MDVVTSIAALRARVAGWRASADKVALVPTMGALHEGHLTLVRTARDRAQRVVVSIFVNPTQFAPGEDFASYPRREPADEELLRKEKVDLLFMPTVEEMYPAPHSTRVIVAGPALTLENEARPGHFEGVATIVAKLLLQSFPDVALFGEKDYQQLLVIRRMVRDLDIPVRIEGVPTVREPDGLALSSRNAYLTADERRAEVVGSQERFTAMLGHPVRTFVSWGGPAYGEDAAVDSLVDEAGYQFQFSNFRIQRLRDKA